MKERARFWIPLDGDDVMDLKLACELAGVHSVLTDKVREKFKRLAGSIESALSMIPDDEYNVNAGWQLGESEWAHRQRMKDLFADEDEGSQR